MSKSNIIKLALATILLTLLTSCGKLQVTIDIGLPPGITVSNAGYSTNFTKVINGSTRFVICDDRTTNLNYHFNYTGQLNSWSSFLKGATTGTEKGYASFSSADIFDPANKEVRVTYGIAANVAPLAVAPINTTGIVPVPKATIIGYTKLFVNINGYAKSHQLVSSKIPVVDNCQ
ncbi:MAG TPA: hypothetical protein ENK21_08340 [Trueperaceae bacterium]|nr:hypothetical protein [Trueperaceae bacterium]